MTESDRLNPDRKPDLNFDWDPKDRISQELERILNLANKMTVTTSTNRQILFQLTKSPIEALLKINQSHFGNSDLIRGFIAVLAKSLLTVRSLGEGQILDDRSDGNGSCPDCDTVIQSISPDQSTAPNHSTPVSRNGVEPPVNEFLPGKDVARIIYCPSCSVPYTAALQILSSQGFGIDR